MREQDPVFYDALFRQKRKGGKWRVMPSPVLEGPVADTHAHLQMLADPACELARAGAHGVAFGETIVDPAEDGFATFDDLPLWLMEAARDLKVMEEEDDGAAGIVAAPAVPHVRIAAGVHPHNAKEWTPELKAALRERLRDRRVSAVGEIGLDYHYDLSPRDVQQDVFRAQIRLAKEAGLPIALHMREAHDDGFAILKEEGFPEAGPFCTASTWTQRRWRVGWRPAATSPSGGRSPSSAPTKCARPRPSCRPDPACSPRRTRPT